jgi:hypothetical protein
VQICNHVGFVRCDGVLKGGVALPAGRSTRMSGKQYQERAQRYELTPTSLLQPRQHWLQ